MYLSLVLVSVLLQAVFGLEIGDKIPDGWPENHLQEFGNYLYAKDPDDCGFGYICNLAGEILDIYDCGKYDAFFSITYKICAREHVLTPYGKETCDYVKTENRFIPKKDDPLCDANPDGPNVDPDNCHKFILCWGNESIQRLDCLEGTGFDPEKDRCENISPSTVSAICGNRNVPQEWMGADP